MVYIRGAQNQNEATDWFFSDFEFSLVLVLAFVSTNSSRLEHYTSLLISYIRYRSSEYSILRRVLESSGASLAVNRWLRWWCSWCAAVAAEKYDPEADDEDDRPGQVNCVSRILATARILATSSRVTCHCRSTHISRWHMIQLAPVMNVIRNEFFSHFAVTGGE